MQNPRLTALLSLVACGLLAIQLYRLVPGLLPAPAPSTFDRLLVTVLALGGTASTLAQLVGAARVFAGGDPRRGLRWILAGSVAAMLVMPFVATWPMLTVAALAGFQLYALRAARGPAGAPPGAGAAVVADTRAMSRLFRGTLAAAVIVPAVVGVAAKLWLDRRGVPTLGWSAGAESLAFLTLIFFGPPFVALAWLARRLLSRRLAADPGWVAHTGIPCWAGALLGFAAAGAAALWVMLQDLESAMILMVAPWWFAAWQVAGGLLGAALGWLASRVGGRRGGP